MNIIKSCLALAVGIGVAIPCAAALPNPILFVGQLPNPNGQSDIGAVTGSFGTHQPSTFYSPRGGSLYVLYPDGTLRDLLNEALKEACDNGRPTCDLKGTFATGTDNQGNTVLTNAYAVRDPTIHWDGNKVIFSMVNGIAKNRFEQLPPTTRWQMYEIANLAQGPVRPVLTKVANQPAFNNVGPAYGSDDAIIFTTDRPITGNMIHYPQLDEYESLPTVSGLWKLIPGTGVLTLMDHSPSGLFTPFVDSFGQVIFTRWDHLQQDQQAFRPLQKLLGLNQDFLMAYTYENENDSGINKREMVEDYTRQQLLLGTPEGDANAFQPRERAFPEYHATHPILSGSGNLSRVGQVAASFNGRPILFSTPQNKYGRIDGMNFNLFLPWQINQDGTGHETFRHFGRHDLGTFVPTTFMDDNALTPKLVNEQLSALHKRDPGGYFQTVEAPVTAVTARGTYVGTVSREFAAHASGFLLQMQDTGLAIGENAKRVTFVKLTDPDGQTYYRSPAFLSDGTLVAAVDEIPQNQKPSQPNISKFQFRLYTLKKVGSFYVPDTPLMPAKIPRTFKFWDPDSLVTINTALWEISPVEVRARTRPPMTVFPGLPAPEQAVFTQTGVDPNAFRQFMRDRDLALIVSRNVTRRDSEDRQQPFNLRVDPINVPAGQTGASTISTGGAAQKRYDVSKLQIYQNDFVRGYAAKGDAVNDGGRRGLPRPLHDPAATAANFASPQPGPPGAVKIAYDGSFAAFVPAGRAVTWALSDKDNDPIVRERYWLKFAPGEVRVCASCHGINETGQDGGGTATQSPEALRELLMYWKTTQKPRVSDLDGDGLSDLVFQNLDGRIAAWTMNGVTPKATAQLISAGAGWSVTHVADTDGARKSEIFFKHVDGRVHMYQMNGVTVTGGKELLGAGLGWSISHTADLNGDGKADLILRNVDGRAHIYLMDGINIIGSASLLQAGTGWNVVGTGDLNGDGKADIVFINDDGRGYIYLMNGTTTIGGAGFLSVASGWTVSHVADVDGDGKDDLIFRHIDGSAFLYLMNGTTFGAGVSLLGPGTGWSVTHVGDLNGDGKADLVFRNVDGRANVRLQNGITTIAAADVLPAGSPLRITQLRDLNGDNRADLVLRSSTDGSITVRLMNGVTSTSTATLIGPGGWSVVP
jgi:hypothetical protein